MHNYYVFVSISEVNPATGMQGFAQCKQFVITSADLDLAVAMFEQHEELPGDMLSNRTTEPCKSWNYDQTYYVLTGCEQ